MPITNSAKKAQRQDARRRKQNEQVKQNVRKVLKQVRDLAAAQKTAQALELLPQLSKVLDKASKRGVIKKNTAARKKSRSAKLLRRYPNAAKR